ncbi:MAG: rRNA adenine N-6-methyltransferase family protein [Desulfohalobiaceae bacterium]
MSDASLYFKKFLKHGRRIASFVPSSRFLAQAMCAHIDPQKPQTIVELGAGTGAVTKIAAEQMHPDSRLVAIESDLEFFRVLTENVLQAETLFCDARDVAKNLANKDVHTVDLILNCLPTPSLPSPVAREIFAWMAGLPGRPWHNQITVMPWVYNNFYKRLFDLVTFKLILVNIPPGGVFYCRGVKPEAAAYFANVLHA